MQPSAPDHMNQHNCSYKWLAVYRLLTVSCPDPLMLAS
uniref:Uncharacterized protein n=1 Tax=Anguilla anguilla TaxID=7936 RepID=A0A0E9UR23_ANGAN